MSKEAHTEKTSTEKITKKVDSARSRGLKKTREGVVVSDKMAKSVVVAVSRLVKHSRYKKFIKRTRKYMAHDEKSECKVGDRVRIVEAKPISRLKKWRVESVIAKAV